MKIFASIENLFAQNWLWHLALCGMAAVYIYSGIDKLRHFDAARAEFAALNLHPAALLVGATILVQLGGALLLFTQRYAIWGALALAGFTAMATLLAHRFWQASAAAYLPELNAFLEHLGLIGGFLLIAHNSARRNRKL